MHINPVRELIAPLATPGKDSNEIKAGAIAFSNSPNQMKIMTI